MDAADLVVEQVAALLGRPVDADLGHGVGVVAAAVDGAQQARREPGTQGQLGHPDHARLRRDRHDARDDRHVDAGPVAALAEVVEVVVLEEELGADVVGPGVHLALQVVELLEPVGSAGVSLGEARDADAEAARDRAGWATP